MTEVTDAEIAFAVTSIVLGVINIVLAVWGLRYRRNFLGIGQPIRIPRGSRRNAVMIVGLGGVGKTALIRTLLDRQDADPTRSTDRYMEYRRDFRFQSQGERSQRCCMFVGDYRGQNVGQLVARFISQQKAPFQALSHGFVNSLILIVDIFEPPKDPNRQKKTRKTPDLGRIRKNVNEWNCTALDAIFGLLQKETLSYVCLFVNKLDRLQADESKIRDQVEKLRLRLEKRADASDAHFEMILGSAITGAGVEAVKDSLIALSRKEA